MNYVAREVPLHLLEWRDRRVDTALEDAADGNSEEWIIVSLRNNCMTGVVSSTC